MMVIKQTSIAIFFIATIFGSIYCQEFKFLEPDQLHEYKIIFINNIGDTLSNEDLEIETTDKRWSGQPGLQKQIIFHHHPNEDSILSIIPSKYYTYRIQNKLRRGKRNVFKYEMVTGGFFLMNKFWMHPPRGNQYRALEGVPYPCVYLDSLPDDTSIGHYRDDRKFFDERGLVKIFYEAKKTNSFLWGDSKYKSWIISATQEGYYNHRLDAVFTMEEGFLVLDWTLDDGYRIVVEKKPSTK